MHHKTALLAWPAILLTLFFHLQATSAEDVRIQFLSADEGGVALAGPEDDEFMADMFPREAAAMMAQPRGDKTVEESRKAVRTFFRNAGRDFTDAEKGALRKAVGLVMDRFGEKYPVLVNRPWKFVKSRRDLCGSFSFTRGDHIVFSELTVRRIQSTMDSLKPNETSSPAADRVESLLLHEKMHTLQRAEPGLFVPLYESLYRFREAEVHVHPWIHERIISNPDGVSVNWVADVREAGETKPYWIGTLLLGDKKLHRMGRDFSTVAIPLSKQDDGSYKMISADDDDKPTFKPLESLGAFTDRLPIPGGYDHPNEVAAYTLTAITHHQTPRGISSEANEVLRASIAWFAKHLKEAKNEE